MTTRHRRIHRMGIAVAAILVAASSAWAAGRVLVPAGAVWKYLDNGTDQGTAWQAPGFDDSSWAAGPAQLGYGDSDESTVVSYGPNSSAKYITTYFRRAFNVPELAAISSLQLRLLRDDGAVVYLNGVGIVTNNLPAAISYTTAASTAVDDAVFEYSLPPSLLVAGTNVLAVEVHQVSGTSSDVSFDLVLVAPNALSRGPFIQMPDTNVVTVVWQTAGLTDSAVDYGLTSGYGSTVSDSALVTNHIINLTGLLAETNYYYRVSSGGTNLTEAVFRTKPATSQPYRFVVLGDFGTGSSAMSNVAAQINARPSDLFLTVGDNIYPNGEVAFYDPYWFSLYGPTMARVPTMPALGNHDVNPGSSNGQPFIDNFYLPTNGPAAYLERNYSFDYGNAHFLVIDSNPFATSDATAMAAIRTWVSNDLAATAQPWRLAFYHHPPYTSQGSHNDQLNVQSMLSPLFSLFGVQFAFQGHNHFYERINAINGVNYITTGGGGQSLYSVTNRKIYSAAINASIHSFSIVEMDGTRLKLRGIDRNGVQIDEFNHDIGHAFKIDGLLDSPAWLRADNGLKLHAAIRGMYLYVATQDAGEGNDNFIYVNSTLSTNRTANWAKAGQLMAWNCFLADENDNAFFRWYGPTEQFLTNFPAFQAMASGLNNNGTLGNGVLEGTVDLTNRFGAFPQLLYLAAASFSNANGGALTAQAPAGDGNGNIESNEYLAVSARDIALDLPIADAGTNQTAEAGMVVVLNGSASTAPSGLPLSFVWTQLSGPVVSTVGSNNAIANFAAASNVASNTDLGFRLTVDDTRFDSNSLVTVTLTPMVDADGDGLSDAEEATGQDNVLTAANPNGQITNPAVPDTDSDGVSDGDEAFAGTNPNSAASIFRITSVAIPGGFTVEWTAVIGKTYWVDFRNDLGNSWSPLTNIVANTTLTNITDTSTAGQPQRFYRVRVLP